MTPFRALPSSEMRLGPFLLLALLLGFGIACERGKDARLEALIAEHPVLVLISSVGVVAGADSLCNDLIEESWETDYPENLADRVTQEQLAVGHEWLRRRLAAMARGDREVAMARIEGRVETYQEVAALGSVVESFATGVARTPSLVDLLPSNINSRAHNPMEVGWTLASAEQAELLHAVVQRLGDMQPHERAAVSRGLKANITWADSMQQEPYGE